MLSFTFATSAVDKSLERMGLPFVDHTRLGVKAGDNNARTASEPRMEPELAPLTHC